MQVVGASRNADVAGSLLDLDVGNLQTVFVFEVSVGAALLVVVAAEVHDIIP